MNGSVVMIYMFIYYFRHACEHSMLLVFYIQCAVIFFEVRACLDCKDDY